MLLSSAFTGVCAGWRHVVLSGPAMVVLLLFGGLHCITSHKVGLPPLMGTVLFTWGALLDFSASTWLGLWLVDACGSRWLLRLLWPFLWFNWWILWLGGALTFVGILAAELCVSPAMIIALFASLLSLRDCQSALWLCSLWLQWLVLVGVAGIATLFLHRVPPDLSLAAGAFAPCGALGWRSVSPPFLVWFTCVLAQHAKYRA